jgi:hypothetical protein
VIRDLWQRVRFRATRQIGGNSHCELLVLLEYWHALNFGVFYFVLGKMERILTSANRSNFDREQTARPQISHCAL